MTKKPHHHGDLYNGLIQAGLEILEQEGLDGLTLRKVAARAGVSHAAPAHHFDGKTGLLVAIATHGFQQFTDIMQAERYRKGSSPQDQLEGISIGYVKFANEHPALFRLIFNIDYKNHESAELDQASSAAFKVLADVCALFEPSVHGAGTNELMIWSIVHGYASLVQFSDQQPGGRQTPIPIEALLPPLKPLVSD